ncbi:arsenite methyltransferase isoform X4 [Perognathus longimembris pacificus]|uniref:arsenite methyltransferase isoform X3 n=1 Tax=Perognathus longimembris pacificus TaxID=214514 RepID=UPI0020198FB8|nr:arsenite methyltransferase isoform X3 [Perognathus longimembris pacificus]XP_048194298.1 arsenite methyltransferase isoform X4 [Perognathus longimembris pacificus]
MAAPSPAEIRRDVQVLKTTADLQSNACVTAERPLLPRVREALQNVHEEVALRYYGCGIAIPECLENCWILDLGCGSGRDCYALSQLVGEKGHVTGIDMTEGQVEVAKKYLDYHMEKFGFQTCNVTFIHGCLEKLAQAGIPNESYDIAISNCVINLVPDKQQVLQEVYQVLKPGGELYFSDVYASLELPEEIKTHTILWGECLGGALYWKSLAILAQKLGFCSPRLVTANFITIQNKELESIVGDCRFVSATFRLFKLSKTGPAKRCQVIYNGGITGYEKELILDANFTFKKGEIVEVDEETAAILKNSRFAQGFVFRPIEEMLELGSCSALKSKVLITDPFKLAAESGNRKPSCAPDVAGGCCGKKRIYSRKSTAEKSPPQVGRELKNEAYSF